MKKTQTQLAPIYAQRSHRAKILADSRLRLAGLRLSGLLACGGLAIFFVRPEHGSEVWAFIGPLIACIVTSSLQARRDGKSASI
jgi:hypothetical protein